MNSLGINKPKKETKVVVAMSGGVDSSVVAALMKQEGYDVTGITLKLYDDTKQSKEGRQCCAGQDILDAKRVSENINIDHKILFYQKKFKSEVIDSFIDSYAAGETPIPCVQCNQTVKFKDLFKYAKDLKADALITGNYVSRIQTNGHANMYICKLNVLGFCLFMNISHVHSQTCTCAVFVITFLAFIFDTLVSHFHMLFQMAFVVARKITFWATVRNIIMYAFYVSFQVLLRVCDDSGTWGSPAGTRIDDVGPAVFAQLLPMARICPTYVPYSCTVLGLSRLCPQRPSFVLQCPSFVLSKSTFCPKIF